MFVHVSQSLSAVRDLSVPRLMKHQQQQRPTQQGADGQTLTEGNVVIEFGGETITPGATPVEVTAGVDLVVTVTATTFRGILARVGGGGDGYDTTGIFSVGNSGGALQISDPCLDLGVGGVTHTGREDKSSVTFTMETPDEVTTEPLALDLSLYTGFSGGASNIYFYGQLLINVVAAEGGNTTDTMAPTSAPGTTTDTMAPTMAPMAEAGSSVSSVTVSAFLMTLAAASAWMLF